MITHTHVSTYNAIEFADPYKKCNQCGGWVTGAVCVTHGPYPNLPCEHEAGYEDVCPSWSPVDGCHCQAYLGYVPHGEPPPRVAS